MLETTLIEKSLNADIYCKMSDYVTIKTIYYRHEALHFIIHTITAKIDKTPYIMHMHSFQCNVTRQKSLYCVQTLTASNNVLQLTTLNPEIFRTFICTKCIDNVYVLLLFFGCTYAHIFTIMVQMFAIFCTARLVNLISAFDYSQKTILY